MLELKYTLTNYIYMRFTEHVSLMARNSKSISRNEMNCFLGRWTCNAFLLLRWSGTKKAEEWKKKKYKENAYDIGYILLAVLYTIFVSSKEILGLEILKLLYLVLSLMLAQFALTLYNCKISWDEAHVK